MSDSGVTDDVYRPAPPALLVEACCDSLHTALAAVAAGAGRIELCGAGDGGTTPSAGMIERVRKRVPEMLAVMIRPRTGDFVYDDDELAIMRHDIVNASMAGADAVVFGVLTREGDVHVERMAELVRWAGSMEVTMHRAFDRTRDPHAAMEALLSLGVDRVLTSGHGRTALEGADTLRALQAQAGRALTVMAGGSVRADNVAALVARSGVHELHARATDPAVFASLMHTVRQLPA